MPSALLHEKTPKVTPIVLSAGSPKSLDMMRALCHDLRQPLAAIRLLAGGGVATFDAGSTGSSRRPTGCPRWSRALLVALPTTRLNGSTSAAPPITPSTISDSQ